MNRLVETIGSDEGSQDMNQCKIIKITVMCLSIGTSKIINFPFVPNGKLTILGSQNLGTLQPHYSVLKYWDT